MAAEYFEGCCCVAWLEMQKRFEFSRSNAAFPETFLHSIQKENCQSDVAKTSPWSSVASLLIWEIAFLWSKAAQTCKANVKAETNILSVLK